MRRIPGITALPVFLVSLSLLFLGPAASAADRSVAAIAPPSSSPYGATYGEWAAAWWQWALAQPVGTNPVIDPTGELCAVGQVGHVWFLAGTFGGSAERTCTVPPGTALLFPVLNAAFFAFLDDPPEQRTEAFLRSQVTYVEQATGLFASVDGQSVPQVARFLEKSVLFNVTLPADNVFGLPEGFVLDPCADEGYYLLLPPLPPGAHTIRFGGTFVGPPFDGFTVDVTYHIEVAH